MEPVAVCRPPVLVIAHRGASGEAPENTAAAFRLAVELGADMVELDVWLTADGHPVVMHDPAVDRTTDGHGRVEDLTLAQVKQLDAGSWFGAAWRGEQVPTFAEALAAIPPTVGLNVHLKHLLPEERGVERAIAPLLAPRLGQAPIYLMCDHEESIHRFRRLLPAADCGPLFPGTWREWLPRAVKLGLPVCQPNRQDLCPELIAAAHDRGMRVNVFWADTAEDMRAFIALGIDGLLTNQTRLLRAVLAET